MAVDPHKAHTFEVRKKVMFATDSGKGTSLLGVTRSSTIVAPAPVFQEVANNNYELLHEAVGGHYSINILFDSIALIFTKVVGSNLGAIQQLTTATMG